MLSFEQKVDEYDEHDSYPGYKLVLSRDILSACSDNFVYYLYHAIVLRELKRYEESRQFIDRAAKLCPEKARYYIFIENGHLCKAKKDYENAAIWFQKAIEMDTDYTSGHTYLGGVLAGMGDLKNAEQSHRNGTRCSKGCIDEAFLNLGYILRAQERFDEALECFKKALELDPDYSAANAAIEDIQSVYQFLSHGRGKRYQDKYERIDFIMDLNHSPSLQLLLAREFAEDYPQEWGATIQYAFTLSEFVRFQEAESVLEKSLQNRTEEHSPLSCFEVGKLYECMGKYTTAKEWYMKCIELKPHDADYHISVGELFYQEENLDDAEEYFRTATDCSEGNIDDAYYQLGLVLRTREKFSDAFECFQKVIGINPDHQEARMALEDVQKVNYYIKSKEK